MKTYDWKEDAKGLVWGDEGPPPPPDGAPSPPHELDPTATKLQLDKALHDAMVAQWVKAEQGDVQAARALVALTERRAKLLGLDAPVRNEYVDLTPLDRRPIRTLTTEQLHQIAAGVTVAGTYVTVPPDDSTGP